MFKGGNGVYTGNLMLLTWIIQARIRQYQMAESSLIWENVKWLSQPRIGF